MPRPDPRTLPSQPVADVAVSNFDDSDAWLADDDTDRDGTALMCLMGAAALAILALALASSLLA